MGHRAVIVIAVASAMIPRWEAGASEVTPVELWKGGDDGLTNRLSEAIREAFNTSPQFKISSKRLPGSLYVGIASNVLWKDVNRRTWLTAQIDVANMPPLVTKPDLSGEVSCWEDEMAVCAKDAVLLAAKARQP